MEELKKTIHELMEEGAESIAICFLHSYANDENEKKALEVIREIDQIFQCLYLVKFCRSFVNLNE